MSRWVYRLVLTTRVVDLVEERIDLAIRSGPLPDSSLVARRVRNARRCFVASPAYLEERGRPRSIDDLVRHGRCSATPTPAGEARPSTSA